MTHGKGGGGVHMSDGGIDWRNQWWGGSDLCLSPLSPHPPPAGPPVNVAMAIEVASIDHISEANMVKYPFPTHNPELSHSRVSKHFESDCDTSYFLDSILKSNKSGIQGAKCFYRDYS